MRISTKITASLLLLASNLLMASECSTLEFIYKEAAKVAGKNQKAFERLTSLMMARELEPGTLVWIHVPSPGGFRKVVGEIIHDRNGNLAVAYKRNIDEPITMPDIYIDNWTSRAPYDPKSLEIAHADEVADLLFPFEAGELAEYIDPSTLLHRYVRVKQVNSEYADVYFPKNPQDIPSRISEGGANRFPTTTKVWVDDMRRLPAEERKYLEAHGVPRTEPLLLPPSLAKVVTGGEKKIVMIDHPNTLTGAVMKEGSRNSILLYGKDDVSVGALAWGYGNEAKELDPVGSKIVLGWLQNELALATVRSDSPTRLFTSAVNKAVQELQRRGLGAKVALGVVFRRPERADVFLIGPVKVVVQDGNSVRTVANPHVPLLVSETRISTGSIISADRHPIDMISTYKVDLSASKDQTIWLTSPNFASEEEMPEAILNLASRPDDWPVVSQSSSDVDLAVVEMRP